MHARTEHARGWYDRCARQVGGALIVGLLSVIASPAGAQSAATQVGPSDQQRLLVGAGVVAGGLAFNALSAPTPLSAPTALSAPLGGVLEVVPQSVMIGGRLVVMATAGAGAVAGAWLYDRWAGESSDIGTIAA